MSFLFVEKFNNDCGLDLPNSVIDFLNIANAGSPKNQIVLVDGKEYVVNNVLNFNSNAEFESFENYKSSLSEFLGPEQIPFCRDGFGNVYFLDLKNLKVSFFDHESKILTTLISFNEFVNILRGE